MKKLFLVTSLFFALSLSALAQGFGDHSPKQKQAPSIWDKLYFGGNFGLQFGTITYIELSPLVGYRVTDPFSIGAGFIYQYFNRSDYDVSFSNYGYRLFSRYDLNIFNGIYFPYVELERLNYESLYRDTQGEIFGTRDWATSLYLGAGMFQPLGSSSAGFTIMALYNVLFDEDNSPYSGPFTLRVGFTI